MRGRNGCDGGGAEEGRGREETRGKKVTDEKEGGDQKANVVQGRGNRESNTPGPAAPAAIPS